jgi:hypothetical protein
MNRYIFSSQETLLFFTESFVILRFEMAFRRRRIQSMLARARQWPMEIGAHEQCRYGDGYQHRTE